MFGVAAGLSLRGFTPFVHTMAAFVTRRALDQLYISCAYQKNTINIFGSDPGFCSGFDGGSHSCFEDLAVMRTIPNAIVCDPCDQVQLDWMVRECASRRDGAIHYIRVDPVTVKPFDEDLILREAQGKKLVVTYENHSIINGIGSAVADVLAKHGAGVPLLKLGINDVFGQVGIVDLLKIEFKLTSNDAVNAILTALSN